MMYFLLDSAVTARQNLLKDYESRSAAEIAGDVAGVAGAGGSVTT